MSQKTFSSAMNECRSCLLDDRSHGGLDSFLLDACKLATLQTTFVDVSHLRFHYIFLFFLMVKR